MKSKKKYKNYKKKLKMYKKSMKVQIGQKVRIRANKYIKYKKKIIKSTEVTKHAQYIYIYIYIWIQQQKIVKGGKKFKIFFSKFKQVEKVRKVQGSKRS